MATKGLVGWIAESGNELLQWRYDEFKALGCTTGMAEKLACLEVSPHDLRVLIARGCDLRTAIRIVT